MMMDRLWIVLLALAAVAHKRAQEQERFARCDRGQCPVLLIRAAGNGAWFAACIPRAN
jgi:hypothetical protein